MPCLLTACLRGQFPTKIRKLVAQMACSGLLAGGGLPGPHSSALPPHQDEGQVSKIPCGGPACPHKPEVKFNQKFRFDRFQQIFNLIGVTMF